MNYLAAHAELAVRKSGWGLGPGGTKFEDKEFALILKKAIEEKACQADYRQKGMKNYPR